MKSNERRWRAGGIGLAISLAILGVWTPGSAPAKNAAAQAKLYKCYFAEPALSGTITEESPECNGGPHSALETAYDTAKKQCSKPGKKVSFSNCYEVMLDENGVPEGTLISVSKSLLAKHKIGQ